MKERRRHKRWRLIHNLEVLDRHTGELIGRVMNISRSGMMLVSANPIKINRILHFTLVLPVEIAGSREIPFDVRSVWWRRDHRTKLYDTGFELLDVTGKSIAAIESLVDAFGSIPESETTGILPAESTLKSESEKA